MVKFTYATVTASKKSNFFSNVPKSVNPPQTRGAISDILNYELIISIIIKTVIDIIKDKKRV